MKEQQIINAFKNCIERYQKNVVLFDGFEFNMPETIEKIELYQASKFESGDEDSLGYKKYFMNILNPMVENAAKNIDIDRSNIVVRPDKVKYRIPAMVYNDKLKWYMEKIGFGTTLNDIILNAPAYGSVVLKKVKGEIKEVPLLDLMFDPAVSNIKKKFDINSNFVIEQHFMDIGEVDAMKWKWIKSSIDAIDERVYKIMAQGPSQVPNIRVLEGYAVLPNNMFKANATGYDDYLVYFTYDSDEESNPLGLYKVLYYQAGVKPPYKKFDYKTLRGRALGRGLIEAGFDVQERVNELENSVASHMRTQSKTTYQTRDKNIAENLLTDTLDGEILKVNSEISLVPTEKRDMADFNAERNYLEQINRSNSNAPEVLTGDTMPSDTPFRTVQQLSVSGGKFFDMVRENMSLFLNEVFTEWLLPQFEKEILSTNEIDLMDMDLWMELAQYEVQSRIEEGVFRMFKSTGNLPTQQDIEKVRQDLLKKVSKNPMLSIDDKFFKFDKNLYIDISGERSKVQRNVESKINALTTISNNPMILQDPSVYNLFMSIMEDVGVSLDDIRKPSGLDYTGKQSPQGGVNMPQPQQAARNMSMATGGAESMQTNQDITA